MTWWSDRTLRVKRQNLRFHISVMYDLIGDIHGHADALQQLLKKLGYYRQKGVYRHPDRQAIFLGDFIDRGPRIREMLEIVRPNGRDSNSVRSTVYRTIT